MDLGELLEVARNEWGDDLPTDGIEAEVTGIAYDSRQVVPGDLFCCLPGVVEDGHDHAPEAALAGSSALLVERPLD
ncbi:MAG: Mur ligase domain-containing protein, partial [Acidimicrobiales bacterium]